MSHRRTSRGRTGTLLLTAVLLAAGCRDAPEPGRVRPAGAAQRSRSAADVSRSSAAGAESVLASALDILRDAYDESEVRLALRQFGSFAAAGNLPALPDERRATFVQLFGASRLDEIAGPQYGPADVHHLFDSQFLARLQRALRADAADADDVTFAETLFDWVCRHVQVDARAPLARPYAVCLRGTGTAAQRAWVFLELLRQANVAGGVVELDGDRPLCVVLHDGRMHLFDPLFGVPLRDDRGGIAAPATMGAGPDGIDGYPALPSATPRPVRLLVRPVEFAPRTVLLQGKLAGDLRTRLTADWSRRHDAFAAALADVPALAGVETWDHPDTVDRLMDDPAHAAAVAESLNPVWLTSEYDARRLQLRGQAEESVRRFVKAGAAAFDGTLALQLQSNLLGEGELADVRVGRLVARTRRDCDLFLPLAQLSRGRPEVALDGIRRYLARYGTPTLQEPEVADWSALYDRFATAEVRDRSPVAKHLWGLMKPGEKSVLLQASKDHATAVAADAQMRELLAARDAIAEAGYEDALQNSSAVQAEQGRRNAALIGQRSAQHQEMKQTDARNRRQVLEILNRLLADDRFFRPQVFAAEASADLDADAALRRNRRLLDAAFPDAVTPNDFDWLGGAWLAEAVALHRTGVIDEAVALLRDRADVLSPPQRAGFLLRADAWQRQAD